MIEKLQGVACGILHAMQQLKLLTKRLGTFH